MANFPQSGIKVQIWNKSTPAKKIAETSTDSNGRFSVNVPAGTYDVWCVDYPCPCDDCPEGSVCTHYGDEIATVYVWSDGIITIPQHIMPAA